MISKLNKTGDPQNRKLFVVPPHAGRSGSIANKLIDTAVNNNRYVYSFELLPATQETKRTSIYDLVEAIDSYMDEPMDMVGICQGGWLSAIYTALYPEKVKKLALMAAPIDVKADPLNKITMFCELYPYEYFEFIVNIHDGFQPGAVQWFNFAFVSPPEVFIKRHLDMFNAIINNDQKQIDKLNRNNDWYDKPQDLAGTWFLEAVDNIFINNRLKSNTMVLNNYKVDLTNINHDLYLYAGEDDEITSPEQLFNIQNIVQSDNINKFLLPQCGHTRVFTGNKELELFNDTFVKH